LRESGRFGIVHVLLGVYVRFAGNFLAKAGTAAKLTTYRRRSGEKRFFAVLEGNTVFGEISSRGYENRDLGPLIERASRETLLDGPDLESARRVARERNKVMHDVGSHPRTVEVSSF
jgi:hypothetical protein